MSTTPPKSPTPETDAAIKACNHRFCDPELEHVESDFARTLEQQRDEALAKVKELERKETEQVLSEEFGEIKQLREQLTLAHAACAKLGQKLSETDAMRQAFKDEYDSCMAALLIIFPNYTNENVLEGIKRLQNERDDYLRIANEAQNLESQIRDIQNTIVAAEGDDLVQIIKDICKQKENFANLNAELLAACAVKDEALNSLKIALMTRTGHRHNCPCSPPERLMGAEGGCTCGYTKLLELADTALSTNPQHANKE